jgi:hypothetical protein
MYKLLVLITDKKTLGFKPEIIHQAEALLKKIQSLIDSNSTSIPVFWRKKIWFYFFEKKVFGL